MLMVIVIMMTVPMMTITDDHDDVEDDDDDAQFSFLLSVLSLPLFRCTCKLNGDDREDEREDDHTKYRDDQQSPDDQMIRKAQNKIPH